MLIYLIQIIIVFGTIVNKVYIYCALLIKILLLLIVNKCKDFTYKIILKSLPSKPTLQIDIELLPRDCRGYYGNKILFLHKVLKLRLSSTPDLKKNLPESNLLSGFNRIFSDLV